MKARTGLVALGITATLALSACQPGHQGHTGLMLGNDGTVHGVVNVCNGSVAQFDLTERERFVNRKTWMFDAPISGTGTVELGTLADFSELVDGSSELYFSAGTWGKPGTTTPLYFDDLDWDELQAGQVAYTDWSNDNEVLVTLAGYDAFEALSCDGY